RWEPGIDGVFKLKKWLKSENEKVKEGEAIAIIEKDGVDLEVYALADGTLKQLTQEGNTIYDSTKGTDIIEAGAHNFAAIVYDEKVPLLHPNGDKQQKGVPFIVIWLVVGAIFFTIRMGFINIRGFKHAIDLARGKYDDPDAPGQVTHFQALTTAVSGTVGL